MGIQDRDTVLQEYFITYLNTGQEYCMVGMLHNTGIHEINTLGIQYEGVCMIAILYRKEYRTGILYMKE